MPFWSRSKPSDQPALAAAGGGGGALTRGGRGGGGNNSNSNTRSRNNNNNDNDRGRGGDGGGNSRRRAEPKKIIDTGNVALNYYGVFPDYVKLVKTVKIPYTPLVFTATGALSPWTRKTFFNAATREQLFGGSFIAHLGRKSVEYRNALPLPVSGLGGNVVLSAEWRLGHNVLKPKLMLALGTDAGQAVMRPGSLFWRKAFFPSRKNRRAGVETAAELSVSMQHSFSGYDDDDEGGGSGGAAGGFRLGVDVRELNLVCRI